MDLKDIEAIKEAICHDRSENCNKRFDDIEKRLCRIDKPEVGALSTMKNTLHEKINQRPTWKAYSVMIAIFLFMLGGSYSYTSLTAGAVERRIDSLESKIEADRARLVAVISRLEHVVDQLDKVGKENR